MAADGGDAAPLASSGGAALRTQWTDPEGSGRAWGRGLRRSVPRSSHADFGPSRERPDPVALLESTNEGRVSELIPIRFGRMSASPFSFFRG
jgi:hypothetical protein